jgi:hypothetical protein
MIKINSASGREASFDGMQGQCLIADNTDAAWQQPDWAVVLRSLAELGLVAVPASPPTAADIVLAAQLRLRYWRRHLRVGQSQPGTGSFGLDRHATIAGADESSDAASRQQLVQVRERIDTIKLARDCLLHWAQFRLQRQEPPRQAF